MAMPKREVRMSNQLWDLIEEIAERFEYEDKRGARSYFIRDVLSDAVAEWKYSPYTSRKSQNFVFVSKEGHLFHRAEDTLRFNSPRERLPCLESQKLEKQKAYSELCPKDDTREHWLKSRWLLNYFAAYEDGQLLDEHVDRIGVTEKTADLLVHKDDPDEVDREMIVALQQYVQWSGEGEGDFDRLQIPIDFPTRDLSVSVILDAELFGDHPPPLLRLSFRNHEGARFRDQDVLQVLAKPPRHASGRFPENEGSNKEVLGLLHEEFGALKHRCHELADEDRMIAEPLGEKLQVVEAAMARKILQSITLPKRYLFFRVEWPTPHLGLYVCVQWKKPPRHPESTNSP